MGKDYEEIDEGIHKWIQAQRMFFVATAPNADDGLINCSPKGTDSFRVLGPRKVAYLDLTGSGVETIAHVKENERIVIMMCAFDGPPKIFRFYGRGEVLLKGSPEFDALIGEFAPYPGIRSIIVVHVSRIIDSCGYSIPRYDYQGERDILSKWATSKGEQGVTEYQQQKNRESLDGLPGVDELE